MSYKKYEKKAEQKLKRAIKKGLPDWAIYHVKWKIDRAKHKYLEAKSELAKKEGRRQYCFQIATTRICDALEMVEDYLWWKPDFKLPGDM